MEPLRGGKLATNLPTTVQAVFNQADKVRTPAEWALRWVWNHPEVSLLLSGMNSTDQVVENIKIAQNAQVNSFTDKENKVIEQAKNVFTAGFKLHRMW
jgi:uncharacterized protein